MLCLKMHRSLRGRFATKLNADRFQLHPVQLNIWKAYDLVTNCLTKITDWKLAPKVKSIC